MIFLKCLSSSQTPGRFGCLNPNIPVKLIKRVRQLFTVSGDNDLVNAGAATGQMAK